MFYVSNLNYEKHPNLRLSKIEVLNTHQIFRSSYSQPETSISLTASPWSWPDSIMVFSLSFQAHKKIILSFTATTLFSFEYLKLTNWQSNFRNYDWLVKIIQIYDGGFIQLHSRVTDFSTLFSLLLNENLPQYLWFMVSKKLRKASVS